MNRTINELKQGLLKCANENENKTYLTGQVIISSICKDAKNTIERLEKENEQLKSQIEKMKCCENCDGWDYISTGERDCLETCCSNRSNWRLRDRS